MNARSSDGFDGRGAAPRGMPDILGLFVLPVLILGAGVGGYFLLLYFKEDPKPKSADRPPPLVETAELEGGATSFTIRVDGTVVPKHEITLAAEVPGRVVALGHDIEWPMEETASEKIPIAKPAKEPEPTSKRNENEDLRAGTYVTKGEVLLRIDPAPYLLEMRKLEAELEQAKVDVEQLDVEKENHEGLQRIADKELKLAGEELKRLLPLYRQGRITESQKADAERQVERAKNAEKTIANALRLIPKRRQRFEAAQRLARAKLGLAKLDLERTLVKAPISGMLSQLSVEENDFIQRGMPLLKIIDPRVMEVQCNLRTDDLYWLWAGDDAPPGSATSRTPREIPHAPAKVIYTVAGREFFWQADEDGKHAPFLSRYETAGLDERTRTVPCRVEVPNPQRTGDGPPQLLPRMFVEVELTVEPKVPLLRIPEKALQPRDQVFTVEDNKLRIHDVHVARAVEGYVLIHQEADRGLRPGQQVVVSQLALAVEGNPVRVAEPEKQKNTPKALHSKAQGRAAHPGSPDA